MKKLLFVIVLSVILAGCSTGNTENQEKDNKDQNTEQKEQVKKTDKNIKEDVYVPNPQVTDDLNLVKVGETVTDAKGELTLKAYKNVNQTVQVGPVELLIKDVKVMHFVPAYSMIDFFHSYTHDEEFDFVKVSVEAKNTSSDTIKFTPVAALNMNSAEHKTWEDDIYLEELGGEIEDNDVKKGNMGFILEDTKEIKSVELLTSDAVDKDQKIIEKAKSIKVDF
ncbi:membrane lipoprotein lipid attachment site-containing protein [Bacillus sp. 03113]|uniref:membrane lipoprotein lipid attachment site-containing protein n=1 Tax=Bacillus sp. 03113 TaxID=2578211 RepID=UPI001144C89B|nr:membrane lipoprotein lipid attachment site-containing protein [Bacillus sp. 03113]